MENRFLISDAAKQVLVEPHVLRYWEDELAIHIRRNELGQRYYTETDIRRFRDIRDLKEQGFQLKAIKMILPNVDQIKKLPPEGVYRLREKLNAQAMKDEKKGTYEQSEGIMYHNDVVHTQLKDVNADERLERFKTMMNDIIRSALKEQSEEAEKNIADDVSAQIQEKMELFQREKEAKGNRQIQVLEKILLELSGGEQLEAACTKEDGMRKRGTVTVLQENRRRESAFANKQEK